MQVDSLPAQPQGKPKNTGVGSLSLLQPIFLTHESNLGFLHCSQIPYQLSYQGSLISESHSVMSSSLQPRGLYSPWPEYWSGYLFPSPGDLPNPGIKPRSPSLQVDSLPGSLKRFFFFFFSVHRKLCDATTAHLLKGASCPP